MKPTIALALPVALSVCTLLAACPSPTTGEGEGEGAGGEGEGEGAGPPLGDPIDAPANTWTFVDFPDATCDDGSTTGIGINPGTSNNVLVFFNGGGACWDFQTCFVLNTATHGPFQAAQLSGITGGGLHGTILDRADAANPFQDWSYVFVPYCTGDIHGGDVVTTYTDGNGNSRTFAHVGHTNTLAYLTRLGATFPTPDKVVISGASAGGGGAVLNYPDARRYWPSSKMYLVDDSLPFFKAGVVADAIALPQAEHWDAGKLYDALCGGACNNDPSQIHAGLARAFPNDRMALLSSEQDQTISAFDNLSGPQFQGALTALVADVLAPSPTWHTFIVNGSSHTMVADLASHTTAGGINVKPWIAQMVTDAADWASVGP